MEKDNIDELFEDSLRAYCSQCRNWIRVSLLGIDHWGCACNMDAKRCMLNPLAQKLRKRMAK